MSGPKSYFDPWISLLALSGVVIAAVGTFVIPPPFAQSMVLPFSKYIIAILIGLILIPATLWQSGTSLRYWILLTVLLLGIGVSDLGLYSHDVDNRTQPYASTRIVIGTHKLPLAVLAQRRLENKEGHPISDADLIREAGGLVATIWPAEEILANRERLEIEYVIANICLGLAIIGLLQSIGVAKVRVPTAQPPQAQPPKDQ